MKKFKSIVIATGIFPPDIGGPASYCSFLADKLHDDGIQVTVVTYADSIRGEKNQKYRVVRVWRGLPKGIRHIIYLLKLIRLASKADFIYALNVVSAGVPARIAARMAKKEFAVRIVGDAAWEMAANSSRTSMLINDFQEETKTGRVGTLHNQQIKTCQAAKLIIVPSKFLSSIVKDWGIAEEKIKVVYNGVEPIEVSISKEEAKKRTGIIGNIILSAGRLVPWKGFKMLIKIMPKLLEINQFFRLVIVGDGPEMKNLKSMVLNMGLDRKVLLVGKKNRNQLIEYLAASEMFLLNTGYEGFSHQIVEAMAAGLPVITTPIGGNREIMKQGENGFMVKYNDEFNLVEAVRTLWSNPELREEFIQAGKQTASLYTLDRMYQETIKVLNP